MALSLCDTNVWLAFTLSKHSHHATAVRWLDSVDQPASVLFCRATQQSYLRLLTTTAVLGAYGNPPLTNAAAWSLYQALHADERIALRGDEPAGLETQWVQYAARESASPKLWMDAYLAAFARTAGARLVTVDTAFGQFDGLDVQILQP